MSNTLRWFTSSYSDDTGGNCVEVAIDWRTSSYSDSGGGNCVEIATCPHAVHLRDSKLQNSPTFTVAPTAWTNFLAWAD
ncbi:DUF397 domain-containing protein [Streptomyces sp. NPDC052236]|uniref:DUF397 domain-containing protein n=1 Tax=Streptomyces sp. NPDC052236 TaxID=3365686 RepID=UPI0037D5FC7A